MEASNLEQMIRQIILDNQSKIEMNSYIERELEVERIERKATIITGTQIPFQL